MEDSLNYVRDLRLALDELPLGAIEAGVSVLRDARRAGRTVFICGNGGSAATASHFVCDLAKNTRSPGAALFRVVGLSDNMPILSAYANDEGFDTVFSMQLANLVGPGDVVVGISTSGNSPNVIAAVDLAKARGAYTIGFTANDGGRLGRHVDLEVRAPTNRIEHAEDLHLVFEHMITARLRESSADPTAAWWPTSAGVGVRAAAEPQGDSTRSEGVSTTLRRLLLLAASCVEASSGCMVLLDDDGRVRASVLFYQGEVQEPSGEPVSETVERGLAGWVLQNARPALVGNTREDPRWVRRRWDEDEARSRSALSVPIQNGDRILGVLTLSYPEVNRFTEQDLALIKALTARFRIPTWRPVPSESER